VVETANLRYGNDPAKLRRLGVAWLRRILGQRQVCSRLVKVAHERSSHDDTARLR
jgi:hypothetical protein